MKIALIGSYPEPYGGVSVHVQRLCYSIINSGINCVVYNLDNESNHEEKEVIDVKYPYLWLIKYFFFAEEDVIHFHYSDWRLRVIFGLMGLFGKNVIVTIHGESLTNSIINRYWFSRKLIGYSLRKYESIIAVNSKIMNCALELGVEQKKINVIPAFIPPIVSKNDFNEIPDSIWDFINNHHPVISANAFKIVFYNNQDLYGIDMCIGLCAGLKSKNPKIGFVFCLPNVNNLEYYNQLLKRIDDNGIIDNFLFINKQYNLYPIIMKSDVFVRPTNTDGDSVSIREALHFNIPVVASDVVNRPEGCISFKNRDLQDFLFKINELLKLQGIQKYNSTSIVEEDNFQKIKKIYDDIYGGGL